jgi:hypothetical protein
MTEDFLHYIWQNKLFTHQIYQADTGEKIEIIDTGILNHNAGPDFFNGKIKIDGTLWAGNVEIHKNASDWETHKHHSDKAYNNVILHVVAHIDRKSFNQLNKQIPAIALKYPEQYEGNYQGLLKNKAWIACGDKIKNIDPLLISLWVQNLGVERIQSKTMHIGHLLERNKGDWHETFYQVLARSFGFGVNSHPFELMAQSLPLKILAKHKSNLYDIEALLFGQSGILELNEAHEDYAKKLLKDYTHLKGKYQLTPIEGFTWKFLRLRPGNFPTIRIAQFASLVAHSNHLLSKVTEAKNMDALMELFKTSASVYWKTHYHFGKTSKNQIKSMGLQGIQSIIINTVAPFLYIYGDKTGKEWLKGKALDYLSELPAESNNIVEKWRNMGVCALNAFESQALIHLKNEYCTKKNCLRCNIGHNLITKPI